MGSSPRARLSLGLPSDDTGLLGPEIDRVGRDELPHVSVYIVDASSAVLFDWIDRGCIHLAVRVRDGGHGLAKRGVESAGRGAWSG